MVAPVAAPGLLWHHVAITAYAAFLKLTLGTDDLVWLAPFMAKEHTRAGKLKVIVLYGSSVTFLVGVAALIGAIFNTAGDRVEQLKFWTKVAAGGLLLLYSLNMAKDDGWLTRCGLQGEESDEEEEAGENGPEQQAAEEGAVPAEADGGTRSLSSGLLDKGPTERSPATASTTSSSSRKKNNNIVVVAMLGSLDDFTVYLVLATSGMFCWYELLVGTFTGCMVLAAIVALVTESEVVGKVLEKIPVWMVLGALAVYILGDILRSILCSLIGLLLLHLDQRFGICKCCCSPCGSASD